MYHSVRFPSLDRSTRRLGFPWVFGLSRWQPNGVPGLLSATIFALSLAIGCVNSSETSSTEPASLEDAVEQVYSSSEADAKGEETDETKDPRNGGVLMVPAPDCGIADPAIDDASAAIGIWDMRLPNEIHAGLITIAEDGDIRAEPELAESFKLRDEGTTYEFMLRNDLRFSDGSALTAQDVKWSWTRALKKSTGSSRANDVLGWIRAAEAVASGDTEDLIGVEVIDERTIKVNLKSARADFPMLLADPIASVLKRENVEKWGFEWTNGPYTYETETPFQETGVPVGAGPFKLSAYVPYAHTVECTLTRNDHYWGRPAYLDGVKAVTDLWDPDVEYQETGTFAYHAFQEERVDFILPSPEDAEKVRAGSLDAINGKLSEVDGAPVTHYLVFNPTQPPFDDSSFRRALVFASGGLSGFGPRGAKYGPRLIPLSLLSGESKVTGFSQDAEAAKRELAESQYSGERTLSINEPGSFFDDITKIIDSWHELLGVDVEYLRGMDTDYYSLLESGELQMRLFYEAPQYPHPHAVLRSFASPFGKGNSSVELMEIEALLAEAVSEQDSVTQLRMYREIEQKILDDALALPLEIQKLNFEVLVQPWVQGLEFRKYTGSAFHNVWLDDSAPQRTLQ